MATKKEKPPVPIYQIKLTLKDFKPPIWRRVELKADTTLYKLHDVIQAAMGWEDSHLHQFEHQGELYGIPDPEFDLDVISERRVRLNQLLEQEKDKLVYKYDFGDGWRHDVRLEKIMASQPGVKYPRCTKGKGACPPEDVGGVWGYAEFLEAVADPKHPEHQSYLEWIGEDSFDPAAFDPEEANDRLRAV